MDVEQIFAAEVFCARRTAAEYAKAGVHQTVPDVVSAALGDLWNYANGALWSTEETAAIVDKYVRYDAHDEPWPREDIDWGNVVVLR